jgi:general transcription factor 3C polypeptide 3 (transcription factor C subunit 4)
LEAAKEKEVVRGYKRVCELWGRMLKGVGGSLDQEAEDQEAVREWMVEAEKMVETFRETRNLFLTSRVSVCFCFCLEWVLMGIGLVQTNPFRGMFPRSKPKDEDREKERERDEADEERMASRLHLEMGV